MVRQMSRIKFLLILLIATSVPVAPALAQTGAGQAADRPDPVQAYLKQKADELSASDRAAQARNLGGTVTSLYNLLRDKGPFRSSDVQGKSPGEQEQVRDALVRTTAYYLASVGMTQAEVNRLQQAGLDPLASGAAVVGGGATLLDALAVAQNAVIARVTANEASSANSIQRTVRFEPVRVIKGGAVASPFSLQPPLPIPPSDAQVGEEYLLFLSQDLGPFLRAAGRRSQAEPLSPQFPPYKVEGGRLLATIPGQNPQETTVAELDALLAKYSSVFKTQGNDGGAK